MIRSTAVRVCRHCGEVAQVPIAHIDVFDYARRCTCGAVAWDLEPMTLTANDRRFLRSLRIASTVAQEHV